MRALLLILILACASACATKQERARKLIDKANKLYPIAQMVDTVLVIDTLIKYDTTIVFRVDSIPFAVKVEAPVNGKFMPFKDKLVFNSNKAQIKATMAEDGTLSFLVDVFPITQYIEGEIKYRDSIQVKKELITQPPQVIIVKGLIWWFGVLCGLAILVFFGFKGYRYYKEKM